MSSALHNKKIIVGISGSIAAYKVAFLTRILIKKGAEVQVIMTPNAREFISPLTFSTLSKRNVHTEIIDEDSWDSHVELGLWADAMIVAPTTATTLAKMANGIADNMLVATYLSSKCPVFYAPAMDLDMWKHPSTIANLEKLTSYGNHLIPVGSGELASGLIGEGRMAEPIDITGTLEKFFDQPQDLDDIKVIITAGPTHEAIDPVRFIGNHSSGKMGIALAHECASRGAKVFLIMGPSSQKINHPFVKRIDVVSAEDMYQASLKIYKKVDVAIFAAAVADFTPIEKATQKIKKKSKEEKRTLTLVRTKDIAAELGKIKETNQINVGFALETENEEKNALRKLTKKNFDFIVMNSMVDSGAGFKHDTNKITIYHKNGQKMAYSLKQKNEVAKDIVNEVIKLQQPSI